MEDGRGAGMTSVGPVVERQRASSPFKQCQGRTVYNAATTLHGPIGDILDVMQSNGEVNPTLMELATIIKEERVREARWIGFVLGLGPQLWANLANIARMSTPLSIPFGAPSISSSISRPCFIFNPSAMLWVPNAQEYMEDLAISEVELEKLFYQYFNMDGYMV